jgi:hypothetical protein
MRTALEEIKFRLDHLENMAKTRPNLNLPDAKVANRYRSLASLYQGIYIYSTALFLEESYVEKAIKNMLSMSQLAITAHGDSAQLSLEFMYLAKSAVLDDMKEISEQLITAVNTNKNELANPLFVVLACLRLGKNHAPYMDLFRKRENKKYDIILPGATEAINYLINEDEDKLVLALDSMLLAHHKEANNRHSDIYNSPAAFLSLAPYLILELSKFLGMDIQSKITQNKQILKIGLMFPTDFPDLPKNHKMPLEVDYLTAGIN